MKDLKYEKKNFFDKKITLINMISILHYIIIYIINKLKFIQLKLRN